MIAGLILAGGRSQRFGSEKAVALLGGRSLLLRAHERLIAGCAAAALSAPAGSQAAALAAGLGAAVLEDPPGGPGGPLGGVLAGLDWARELGADLLVTLPCDTPLAPADLVARLSKEIGAAQAAVARSPSGLQPLCAAWRPSLAKTLRAALAQGVHPPVHRLLTKVGAAVVDFPDDQAFANINTLQDLADAERRLAGA